VALALTGSASGTSIYRPDHLAVRMSRAARLHVAATPATAVLVAGLVLIYA